ncbi:MAG: MBL fold metallo-hydrolase [Deltaproteobacteria bacterium]|nr:MBL fold metallo-hydrolase [Deltaproteobacteria bacterium]
MRLCALASGSRGNSIYLEGGGAKVLIDAGLCGRELTSRLDSIGVDPETLDAVIVTHDHRDHVSGVGIMARRYNLPVYSAYGTIKASEKVWGKISHIDEIESGTLFSINDLEFYPFSTPHDSRQSVGFIFRAEGKKGGIATDLGYVTRLVRECLKGCNVMVVESNHDETMLIDGPYPWHLKQRVKGREGHLSNLACTELVEDVYHEKLQSIVLAHLSEVNNNPDLAYETLMSRMKERFHGEVKVSMARQERVGEMIKI